MQMEAEHEGPGRAADGGDSTQVSALATTPGGTDMSPPPRGCPRSPRRGFFLTRAAAAYTDFFPNSDASACICSLNPSVFF